MTTPIGEQIAEEPDVSGQLAMAETLAQYMSRNWTREQIAEFCLRMLGNEARAWYNRKQEHCE
jgi:acetyl-CoA acetyltransferase